MALFPRVFYFFLFPPLHNLTLRQCAQNPKLTQTSTIITTYLTTVYNQNTNLWFNVVQQWSEIRRIKSKYLILTNTVEILGRFVRGQPRSTILPVKMKQIRRFFFQKWSFLVIVKVDQFRNAFSRSRQYPAVTIFDPKSTDWTRPRRSLTPNQTTMGAHKSSFQNSF